MCDLDDDEVCEVWSEQFRVARKSYKCSCCQTAIQPGAKYLNHFSLYEGDPCQEKLCIACSEARDAFTADPHHHVIPNPAAFDETLEMCISYGDEESDTKWAPMLKAIRERQRAARGARP